MEFYQVFKCVPCNDGDDIYSFEKVGDYKTMVEANATIYNLVTSSGCITKREHLFIETCKVPQFIIDDISNKTQPESWRRSK